jgi:hypothetical protein
MPPKREALHKTPDYGAPNLTKPSGASSDRLMTGKIQVIGADRTDAM